MQHLLLVSLLLVAPRPSSSQTNSQDVSALQALMKNWQNVPQNWTGAADPCTSWDGISCANGRVTEVKLPSMNLQGTLSNAIDQLPALTYLDLSDNPNLGGPLTPNIGNLKQLTKLNLQGCSFTGNIPEEIGNLSQLTFLALNSNNFTGGIPPTLGHLSNLYLLDLTANQLSGQIPVSTSSSPGLDLLVGTKHFHFGENQLIGPISESLFNSNMSLIHVFFQKNKFTGTIPESLGLVQTLEIIQLEQNQFSGPVPKSIGNLQNLTELILASNQLNGAVPDLSNANKLNYVDLSNNNFTRSPAPGWFSTLTSLNILFMDNDGLTGPIPSALFSFPQLQQVSLTKNTFTGTLSMRSNISPLLRVVNLTNNQITDANVDPGYNISLILTGNPICLNNATLCEIGPKQQGQPANPATSQTSASTYPFQGSMILVALVMYSLF